MTYGGQENSFTATYNMTVHTKALKKLLAGVFSRIHNDEFEKAVEKVAIWAKTQMKGVPKGTPFLLPGKGGPEHGRRNSF